MEAFLASVKILGALTSADLGKLVDVMEERDYEPRQRIIQRGEVGEEMFVLMRGRAQAVFDGQVVQEYNFGDYFGELALLNGAPRAVDVVAVDRVTCAVLRGEVFRRLLGPLSNEMAQRAQAYRPIGGPPSPEKPTAAPMWGFFGCCACNLRPPVIQQLV